METRMETTNQRSGMPGNTLPKNLNWTDDMRKWPKIEEVDIFTYLLDRKACDLRQMKSFKASAAYNYFLSECVGTVLVSERGKWSYLKAQVRPSQSVNETYQAWILADKDGGIHTGGCVCKAGESTVCSHVAAILYKVNYGQRKGLCGETCTDKQQTWNSGTSRNVTPSEVNKTNFKKPKPSSDFEEFKVNQKIQDRSPIKKLKTTDELMIFTRKSQLSQILQIGGSLFSDTLIAPKQQNVTTPEVKLPNLHLAHGDHDTANGLPTCIPCREFYNNLIMGDQHVLTELARKTINQSGGHDPNLEHLWKFTRRIRLTSSTVPNVPKRATTDPAIFLRNQVFGSFRGNKDTARGLYGEGFARAKYTELTGIDVLKSGIQVSSTEPWLAASPDGLISNDSILETKCPDPDKFESYLRQKSYEIVRLDTGNYDLRKNKSYYTQVQLCMFCLERTSCVFMIYLGPNKDAITFTVNYDKDFIAVMLPKMRLFYFTQLLPFIVDNFKRQSLTVPKLYYNLFSKSD